MRFFDGVSADGARTDRAFSARLVALERAIAAYGGELLPGCYDDWLLLERARLAERFLDALEQTILLLEQRRDSDRASASATRSACCAMTPCTKQPTAISSRAYAGV